MSHDQSSGGSGPRHYCVFYSRPPLFFEVHASSSQLLRKRVEEIDTVIRNNPMTYMDTEISEARSEIMIDNVGYEFLQSTLNTLEAAGAIIPNDELQSYQLSPLHNFTHDEVETLMKGDIS